MIVIRALGFADGPHGMIDVTAILSPRSVSDLNCWN